MPEEYEIRAVMENTDCDRETSIKALKETDRRVWFAIRRVFAWMNTERLHCGSCGESIATIWKFCPACGAKMDKEDTDA